MLCGRFSSLVMAHSRGLLALASMVLVLVLVLEVYVF